MGAPFSARPKRQLTCRRQGSNFPAGWVLALMTLEAAPTPCSRTGFHMMTSSWCVAVELVVATAVVHATGPTGFEQVGSIMIRSPGAAASIALWILAEAATCVGALPPMVTVTVSIDCRWLSALVMASSPHCAVDPPYCACCCMVQVGTPAGTFNTMPVSVQVVMFAADTLMPPMVTVPFVPPKP